MDDSGKETIMSTASSPPAPSPQPTEDRRWRTVNRTMRLHGHKPQALIETLHAVQESFGYLDLDSLRYVASKLQVPLSRVYAVATFYHYFTMKPPGDHTCVICMGTACYIGGASGILEKIQETYQVTSGETTADNRLSLVTARCLGSCGLAPAGVFDGEVAGKLSPEGVLEKLGRWTRHDDDP